MPHLSKKELDLATKNRVDEKIIIMLTETGSATRKKIFTELFTKTERLMMAKRLFLIYMINNNIPTHTIASRLRMSPSTVAKYEINHTNKKYSSITNFLDSIGNLNKLGRICKELLKIPYEARKKSFYQMSKNI